MPRYYSKFLGPTLTEAVEAQLQTPPDEQVNLLEELSLIRVLAGDSVRLYSAAVEGNADPKIKANAVALMYDALNEVRTFCESAAKVDATRKDSISPAQIKHVINQILRLMYSVCGDDNQHLAEKFEKRLRDEIRLPSDPEGTDLDPRSAVQEMIDSIPDK